MLDNSKWKKGLEGILKKSLPLLSLALTSCMAGELKVVRLNQAPTYQEVNSDEGVEEMSFAVYNVADFRGDNQNLFTLSPREETLRRIKVTGDYFRQEGIDLIGLIEVDSKETLKTGFLDQQLELAKVMGEPHNYVVVDEFLESHIPLIPWTTGNAMISKYPLRIVHRHFYGEDDAFDTRIGHLYKDFIHVIVKVGEKELNVLLTHLDDEENPVRRKKELKDLGDYVTSKIIEKNPSAHIALMMDANSSKDSKEMQKFLSQGIFYPPQGNFGVPTYRADDPVEDLSHVLVRNLVIKDYLRFCLKDKDGEDISDHCGIRGNFVFPKAYTFP